MVHQETINSTVGLPNACTCIVLWQYRFLCNLLKLDCFVLLKKSQKQVVNLC